MKYIMYISGINWDWIFQRPQILALELEKYYDVTVLYPKKIIKFWKSQKHTPKAKRAKSLITFPFQNKIKFLKTISEFYSKKEIEKVKQYDAIWFGYPAQFSLLPKDYAGVVIYDCMDNHCSMTGDIEKKKELQKNEMELFKRADCIFVSSLFLKEYALQYADERKVHLIRNGIFNAVLYPVKPALQRDTYKLGYVGTIESWFDYEPLLYNLEQNKDIEYHLVGPCKTRLEHIRGIFYDGVVEHEALYSHIEDYDCMIMPFQITDTIKAVDPVKLYEYIGWGKCIISVYYSEIERFGEFVYFYSTPEEYYILLMELKKKGFPPKYNAKQQREFLYNNTWDIRGKQIYSALEGQL